MTKLPFITLFLLILLSSCDNILNDFEDCINSDEVNTYLTIQVGSLTNNNTSTRSQGNSPSINDDATDKEDFIHKVVVLIFEPGTTGKKIAEGITASETIIMKVKPVSADFYFIANYPEADEPRIKSMTKADIEKYLQEHKKFPNYQGATEKTNYFPMARVYRNQQIPEGGTMMLPKAFNPFIGSSKQLAPISNFGQDNLGKETQSIVHLVRSCAKISLKVEGKGIEGTGLNDIQKIEYLNAVSQYTFAEQSNLDNYVMLTSEQQPIPFSLYKYPKKDNPVVLTDLSNIKGAIEGRIYVPERLFSTSETLGWEKDATRDEPIGAVQYIRITCNNGVVYKIPLLSNGDKADSNQSYINFAHNGNSKGEKPDYRVVRNMHYHYDISIKKQLVITFSVTPINQETLDEVIIYPTQ